MNLNIIIIIIIVVIIIYWLLVVVSLVLLIYMVEWLAKKGQDWIEPLLALGNILLLYCLLQLQYLMSTIC